MFDLTVGAHHGRLAIGLDALGSADGAGQAFDDEGAEIGAVGLDLWLEVFDEALAGPGIANDHGDTGHGHGLVGGLAAFAVGLFEVGDDLADFKAHGDSWYVC
ncbi:hypothetical protein Q3H58_000647 [Pseudomonas psychrotolerans]|nr:hypothetical protein [Pseudomonas psychrotolerans]